MDSSAWFGLAAVASYAFARLAKMYPKLPKGALPWVTLGAGYAIMLLKLRFVGDGDPAVILGWQDAALEAWCGLGAGAIAVGGHEALKPLATRLLGEEKATKLLGKLPKPKPKTKKGSTLPAALVVAFLVTAPVALTGCPAAVSALAAVADGATWLGGVLDTAEAGADAYFDRHPSPENEPKVEAALEIARATLAALEAADDGDLEKTRTEALAAAAAVRDLLGELGILSATPPEGGAETEAAVPEPFELPSDDEMAARLGG